MKNNKFVQKKHNYIRATGIIRNSNGVVELSFVGKRVSIYNGKLYQTFTVKRDMVGYKFGFFITTKSLGPKIHISVNSKKQKKIIKKK